MRPTNVLRTIQNSKDFSEAGRVVAISLGSNALRIEDAPNDHSNAITNEKFLFVFLRELFRERSLVDWTSPTIGEKVFGNNPALQYFFEFDGSKLSFFEGSKETIGNLAATGEVSSKDGLLYIADYYRDCVFIINLDTGEIERSSLDLLW